LRGALRANPVAMHIVNNVDSVKKIGVLLVIARFAYGAPFSTTPMIGPIGRQRS
jgi:hypothetical protein